MTSQPQRPITYSVPKLSPRRHALVEDDIGSWPITFSDLVLLLLCFFVLYHVAEKQRWAAASHPEPSPIVQQTAPPASEPQLTASTTTIAPPAPEQRPPSDGSSEQHPQTTPSYHADQAETSMAVVRSDWRQALQAQLERYVHTQGLDRTIGVISTEEGVVISLSETVTFPSGRAALSPVVTPLLAQVATLASERTDLDIEITGHTDDRQIATAEFPSNWELSAARASRVARALVERKRMDPVRVSTRGYASYRPIYPNDTEEHRAANRRVELRFFQRVEMVY